MILFRKTFFASFMLSILLNACSSSSSKNKLQEDSLIYKQPTPQQLSKTKFRELYRMADAFYDTTLLATGFNGGFLVAKGGTIIYERYNGRERLGNTDSISSNTSFHIASTTKTFTAMGILYLVQAKKLFLNDSVQKFFPLFPYQGITIQMLLSQRTGLPNYMNAMESLGWNKKQRATNKDVLDFFTVQKPNLQFTSGKRFNYSNTNFLLLAMILEKITGKSYKEFMTEIFFKPLQMNNSFVFSWADSATVTPSYRWNGAVESFTWMDETVGDKNIYSTVRDLLKWDQALYTDQLISKALKEAAFTPYSFEKPGMHNYGLGWRMYTLPQNKNIIYHNGWWHGNNSCFYRVISDSITIIILGNKFNRNIYHVKPLIEAITPLRFNYDGVE